MWQMRLQQHVKDIKVSFTMRMSNVIYNRCRLALSERPRSGRHGRAAVATAVQLPPRPTSATVVILNRPFPAHSMTTEMLWIYLTPVESAS